MSLHHALLIAEFDQFALADLHRKQIVGMEARTGSLFTVT